MTISFCVYGLLIIAPDECTREKSRDALQVWILVQPAACTSEIIACEAYLTKSRNLANVLQTENFKTVKRKEQKVHGRLAF